ncbi:EF-P lysine aminoacylase EpmA [Botrimarina hoheduenensis]|uniref:EF-P lysine aminoacylase EpmA n=1 Tax=Botrimarina hoheduenensis TaxID=2528000 RepID=UPI0018D2BE6E|nr:EF-P lysine aminoacylase EpmA [Botrimarina hoheduenensis]
MENLRRRARLLAELRRFFVERGFLEVETPLASSEVIPEQHIEPIALADGLHFLQASPELHHKRLLCAGAGALFEITRSFRGFERGPLHRPEFTIVEWYRPGDDLAAGMALLDELLQSLLGLPAAKRTSYREAFQRTLAIDPHTVPIEQLCTLAAPLLGHPDEAELASWDRDDVLNALLSLAIEAGLGASGPELLYHYPATQAALARTALDGHGVEVAERFELYLRGIELANGYDELTDEVVLRTRLEEVNRRRVLQGSSSLPLPERLLSAMAKGRLPACTGVALGFDRLAMVAVEAREITEVVAFADS